MTNNHLRFVPLIPVLNMKADCVVFYLLHVPDNTFQSSKMDRKNSVCSAVYCEYLDRTKHNDQLLA